MKGGSMLCAYPTDGGGASFPLLSFEHGDLGGGIDLGIGYKSFLYNVASAGFVVCASLQCPISCRATQHEQQLNAITAAKALGESGVLPVRAEGAVGVVGHSTGGMTTFRCAYKNNTAAYGVGAAVAYNGDGGSEIAKDNIRFEDIDSALPMFLVSGNKDIIEPKGSTVSNHDAILQVNPSQPLLVALIDGEGHLDPIDIVRPAPLLAASYISAFFGYTLAPSDECSPAYQSTLGEQLQGASSGYYDNKLFTSAGLLV